MTIWCPFHLPLVWSQKGSAASSVLPKTHTHMPIYTHPSVLKITLYQLSRATLTAQQNTSETRQLTLCVCVCVLQMTPYYTAPLVQQMARDIKQDLASGFQFWPLDHCVYLTKWLITFLCVSMSTSAQETVTSTESLCWWDHMLAIMYHKDHSHFILSVTTILGP